MTKFYNFKGSKVEIFKTDNGSTIVFYPAGNAPGIYTDKMSHLFDDIEEWVEGSNEITIAQIEKVLATHNVGNEGSALFVLHAAINGDTNAIDDLRSVISMGKK